MSAINNARWIAASQAVKVGLQFFSVAVLARLLQPHDYGLMAMLMVVTNLVGLLRDMGTAAAIVQDPKLTDRTTNAIFWVNVGIGALLSVALAALSAPLADAFRAPELVPMLLLTAPTFVVTSCGAVPKALLERRSDFATVATVEISTAVLGLAVTVWAAWAGAAALSWVYGGIASSLLSTAIYLRRARWRPRMFAGSDRFGDLLRFSGNLSAFNIVNYFARNADAFIIGRYLGAAALGVYSTAYKLMLFPLQNMTFVANRALYPVMCRKESVAEMAALYLKSVSVIVVLTAPLMAGMFVLRVPFIEVLMGSKWLAAADLLMWLAPVGLLQSIVSTTGTVSMVRGRTDLLLRIGLFGAALQVAAFVLGVRWGVEGVAACYAVANLINALPALAVALKQLDSTLGDLARAIWAPLTAAVVMAVLLFAGLPLLERATAVPLVRLAVGATVGAVLYGGLMLLFGRPKLMLVMALVPGRR